MSIMDRFSMRGKVAVVTGGNRSIGRAIAIGFAEAGAAVAIAARDEKKSEETVAELRRIAPYDPDHLRREIGMIEALQKRHPKLPQVACFDTAFHHSMPQVARQLPIPRRYGAKGVKRYGFHGLSYKYIATRLSQVAPDIAGGRIVAAHLGSGASLCALEAGVSRDTSMGFSTLDGIPMATRCGALDPGVVIHLLKERGLSIEAVEDMLYHRSGLLGVSGISADSRDLIGSDAPEAREALDLFAFRIAVQSNTPRYRGLLPAD